MVIALILSSFWLFVTGVRREWHHHFTGIMEINHLLLYSFLLYSNSLPWNVYNVMDREQTKYTTLFFFFPLEILKHCTPTLLKSVNKGSPTLYCNCVNILYIVVHKYWCIDQLFLKMWSALPWTDILIFFFESWKERKYDLWTWLSLLYILKINMIALQPLYVIFSIIEKNFCS